MATRELDVWRGSACYKHIVKVNVRTFFKVLRVDTNDTYGYVILIGKSNILMHDISVDEKCNRPAIVDKLHVKLSTPVEVPVDLISQDIGLYI